MILSILEIAIILGALVAFLSFGLPAVLFFRLKFRMQEMIKLAQTKGLFYEPGEQMDFKECQKRYALFSGVLGMQPDRKLNFIKGNYNEHSINIYDLLFPGPKISYHFINDYRKTVIEVDEKYLKGKEREYQMFSLGDQFFTSIFELKRILKKL